MSSNERQGSKGKMSPTSGGPWASQRPEALSWAQKVCKSKEETRTQYNVTTERELNSGRHDSLEKVLMSAESTLPSPCKETSASASQSWCRDHMAQCTLSAYLDAWCDPC